MSKEKNGFISISLTKVLCKNR